MLSCSCSSPDSNFAYLVFIKVCSVEGLWAFCINCLSCSPTDQKMKTPIVVWAGRNIEKNQQLRISPTQPCTSTYVQESSSVNLLWLFSLELLPRKRGCVTVKNIRLSKKSLFSTEFPNSFIHWLCVRPLRMFLRWVMRLFYYMNLPSRNLRHWSDVWKIGYMLSPPLANECYFDIAYREE